MVKPLKGANTYVLIFIFILIMTAIVFGIILNISHTLRWGPCWANFVDNEMGKVAKGLEKLETTTGTVPVSISMGDCVWRFDIVSKGDMAEFRKNAGEFRDDIKCTGSSLVALPYFEGSGKILEWKFWKIPKNTLQEAKNWWKENIRGIKPQCKTLEKDISSLPVMGPEQGKTRTVCLELSGEGENYKVIMKGEGSCETG